MRPSSASAFEAPAARRSSGSPWRSRRRACRRVAVHTHVFARLVRSVATANGMPTLRQAFVPQPVVGRTAAELRAYIDGTDPVNALFVHRIGDRRAHAPARREGSGGPVVHALDAPTARGRHRRQSAASCSSRTAGRTFSPIVLPTEERVAAMLAARSRGADEVVGRLRPTAYREFWEFTVEKVAVNAVMAGAKPRVPAGDPRDGRKSASRVARARRPRRRPSRSSTARSATRSA